MAILESREIHREPYKGSFANMRFPQYRFQEYPKVIGRDKAGRDIVVESQREELEFMARGEIHEAKSQSLEADRDLAVELAAQSQKENVELKARLEEMERKFAEMAQAKTEPTKTPLDLALADIPEHKAKR